MNDTEQSGFDGCDTDFFRPTADPSSIGNTFTYGKILTDLGVDFDSRTQVKFIVGTLKRRVL